MWDNCFNFKNYYQFSFKFSSVSCFHASACSVLEGSSTLNTVPTSLHSKCPSRQIYLECLLLCEPSLILPVCIRSYSLNLRITLHVLLSWSLLYICLSPHFFFVHHSISSQNLEMLLFLLCVLYYVAYER